MQQDPLFHDDILDALRAIVERAGGYKPVGARLRPTKSPDHAGRWLADCLNPLRQERLDPHDVIALLKIGREVGYHGAMQYIGTECAYRCEPVEPEDERDALMRDYIESVRAAQRIATRLEKLASPIVKAVA